MIKVQSVYITEGLRFRERAALSLSLRFFPHWKTRLTFGVTWWINGFVCRPSVSDKIPEMSTLKGRKGFRDFYHDYSAHWLGAGRKQKLLARVRGRETQGRALWEAFSGQAGPGVPLSTEAFRNRPLHPGRCASGFPTPPTSLPRVL